MDITGAPRVVVVTGVSRFLGAHIAAQIAADPRVERVVGLDRANPPDDYEDLLAGVDVRRVDLTRNTGNMLAKLRAEAVVHLAVVSSPQGSGGRAAMKEQNVIGTMHLLAACQQAPTLKRLVVRSSTAAYGASFRDPAVFTEDTEARDVPRGGYGRDILDIEGYVRGFRRRRADVTATVLRFAPFVGPTAETVLLRYFAQPLVPTVLGRDPRLQFIHVDDALEILRRSVVEDHPGTFNVAGPGVITLSQALRRSGRVTLPIVEPLLQAATRLGGVSLDQVDLFVHGRVVDTQKLTQEFGFTPRSTSVAFDDFIKSHEAGTVLTPERIDSFLDMIKGVRGARGSRGQG
ncbi:NAD-dependent epimerase/dehydratase family protein [Allorhizocola rhizosphaerae]|uniref:NAD-dependent epimerase/dehydratase family protein n=1 Tax=Allorhizocola rhizosphaerae TaxID=1872709 RepID=UPI000E3D472E|nr:NAD-dependent epimerase/dehydratase family protein [Allorhizocola rhizosphaerae]